MEAIAREAAGSGSLVRINPSDPDVPADLACAVGIAQGWDALLSMRDLTACLEAEGGSSDAFYAAERHVIESRAPLRDDSMLKRMQRHFGHFDWRHFIGSLKR